ncbi:MAG TPA: Hsp20/alpha crystallin family protein [Trebonia sp.]|jgi:HSP20 family protein
MYLTTLDPAKDFDRIVRRAFGGNGSSWAPALPMDTVRRDGEVVLRFDVPGVPQDKIDVTVDKGVLTVSATREDAVTEGENPVVRERLFGSFTRRVRLSDNLDAEAIEASHHDGVLEVRIPVREAAKPRKIAVGTASVAGTASAVGTASVATAASEAPELPAE